MVDLDSPDQPPVDQEMPAWRQKRRDHIVRAALELLETGDYDKIQVRDVAQHAGVALGTVYRYFSSKEHLYAAVMVLWGDSFQTSLRHQPLTGTPPDRLKEAFSRVIQAFEHRRQFLRLQIVLVNSTDEDVVNIFSQVGQLNLAGLREALPGVDATTAERVVRVVACVLQGDLQIYAIGRISVGAVYQRLYDTIDLIFSPAPIWTEG